MSEPKIQAPLMPDDISYLNEKKNEAVMWLTVSALGLIFAYVLYFALLFESPWSVFIAIVITVVCATPVIRWADKILIINRDLRGNIKTIFTAAIEDFQQIDSKDKHGAVISSEYFLFLEGERYEVKEEHFFKFMRGDTVKVSYAPHSGYVFTVEKIASAARPAPDPLFHFTSPLY